MVRIPESQNSDEIEKSLHEQIQEKKKLHPLTLNRREAAKFFGVRPAGQSSVLRVPQPSFVRPAGARPAGAPEAEDTMAHGVETSVLLFVPLV